MAASFRSARKASKKKRVSIRSVVNVAAIGAKAAGCGDCYMNDPPRKGTLRRALLFKFCILSESTQRRGGQTCLRYDSMPEMEMLQMSDS